MRARRRLACLLLLGLLCASLPPAGSALAAGPAVPGSVHPATAKTPKVGRKAPASRMPVTLILRPGSASADAQDVLDFMSGQGFALQSRFVRNAGLRFSGTVAQVERTFATQIQEYRRRGRTFYANAQPIFVPSVIARHVAAVMDLDDVAEAKPLLQPALAGPGGGKTPPYAPSQIKHFYNSSALEGAGFDGAGQKIGIISFATFKIADVRAFQAAAGLPASTINVVTAPPLNGKGPATSGSGAQETTLDVTWASAMAPGAEVDVVLATNGDWVGAFNTMAAVFDPDVISISWGVCDDPTAGVSGTYQDSINTALTSLNLDIPILVSSGDNGSRECVQFGDSSVSSVSWPSSDPLITSIGGTRLNPDSLGNPDYGDPSSETSWNCGSSCASKSYVSSGGGYSANFTRPAYQNGVVSNAMRGTPDVSLLADPNTGYALYYGGKWLTIGGTSAAAPALAGILAEVNQARGQRFQGGADASSFNSVLYQTLGPSSAAFNDIADGTSNGDYVTTAGWDPVVGLGSVDARQLLIALGGSTLALGSAPAAVSGGVQDDKSGNISYSSGWAVCVSSPCNKGLNKSLHITSTVGATATMEFSGPAVTLAYAKNFDGGMLGVSIDGAAPAMNATIDQAGATFSAGHTVSYSGLSAGNHTLVLTLNSGATAYLDALTLAPRVIKLGVTSGQAGTTVKLTGSGFSGATQVNFGGAALTTGNFTIASDTSITAVAPAGAGAVRVTVDSTLGSGVAGSGSADLFSYAPVVTGLSKAGGPASGTHPAVTVKGANLAGVTAVFFGSIEVVLAAANTSKTGVKVTPPDGTGIVPITVVGPGGPSSATAAPLFSYGPVVTGVKPKFGAPGATITITGFNFSGATEVDFGDVAVMVGSGATVKSDSSISVVAPPNSLGRAAVRVTVIGPNGSSADSAAAVFGYTQ